MTRLDARGVAALVTVAGAVTAFGIFDDGVPPAPDSEGARSGGVAPTPPPRLAPAPRRSFGAVPASDGTGARNLPAGSDGAADTTGERPRSLEAAAADPTTALAAVPRAIEALHEEDEAVRAAAARDLAAAGRAAVEPLVAAVREDIAAHGTQWSTFPAAASVAFDGLVEGGADLVARALGEPQLDFWAAATLGRAASLRKDLHRALPVLQELLQGENERARQWAAQAVPAAGPGADRVVPDLARCLRSANVQTRLEAVQALRRIGPPAAGALSDLRALSSDPNETVRRLAVQAIGSIEAR